MKRGVVALAPVFVGGAQESFHSILLWCFTPQLLQDLPLATLTPWARVKSSSPVDTDTNTDSTIIPARHRLLTLNNTHRPTLVAPLWTHRRVCHHLEDAKTREHRFIAATRYHYSGHNDS
jgi:hypothetical protein